jgi:6,7-dimethyl-8-ribityllumazine synthase
MTQRYLIVAAEFNDLITRALVEGALGRFRSADLAMDKIETIWVPGAFELPVVASKAARSGNFSAILCLGCVIRGETPHFDYVAGEAARGLMQVSIDTGVPIIFGVLTTEDSAQALERCGLKGGNKGADAASAAMKMSKVMKQLEGKNQR